MRRLTLAIVFAGSTALAGAAPLSAAMAQTAPAPKPPAAAPTPPAPPPAPQSPPAPGATAQNAPPVMPAPNGPPEGMIIETPNGFYLVRPGDSTPRRLDFGQNGPGQGPGAGPGPNAGQGPGMGPGPGMGHPADDEAMGDEGDEGMPPPPPHPHRPPPHPMEGKGARFRIHTPSMNVGVKCPDDEPMKACVDAIAGLIDKLAAPAH